MSALCLSPTARAAARATRRMCDAGGGILFGPGATTLSRVAPLALAAAGDHRPVLPPLAERMLALEAGVAAGGAFAALAPGSGLAGALARAVAELRRGEVTAAALRDAAAAEDGAPARRLLDLAGVLAVYETRLADLGALDAPAAARAAALAVRRGAWPERGSLELLVVDGVTAASPGEWELLAALLGRARRSRVHSAFLADRPDACAPAEPLVRRIEALHESLGSRDVELAHPALDARAPRLAAVLAALGGGPSPRPPEGEGLVLAAPGAGERGEAEAAADAALLLVERHGLAPEELVVLSPSPRRHAAPLARAFAARGVPFAAGSGPPVAEVPVVQLVLELLAARPPLDRSEAARVLSSSWLAPEGVPRLAELLEKAGALDGRGPAAAALRRRAAALSGGGGVSRERARLLAAAERLEALEAQLAPLARAAPARDHARRLAALAGALGLARRAARGPLEAAARDVEALTALDEAADEVVRAATLAGLAERSMSAAASAAHLGRALEARALRLRDEPAAGAVELLSLDDAAAATARGAILVGCAEGALPPPPQAEPLLREPDRLAVNRVLRRPALAPAGARRAEALHRAFLAMAVPTEALVLAWAAPGPAGDGGPPAPLAIEALAAAGVPVPRAPTPEPALGDARTARAALRAAGRLGPAGAAALAATPLGARAAVALARGGVERERRAAVLASRPGPFAGGLAGAALDALRAALPAEWTPSQLEAHARCPFQSFARLALRLDDPGEPGLDIEARREGELLHALLERFVGARVARGAWPPAGTPEDQAEARAVAQEVLARFEREGKTGDPAAWAGRREAVLHRLDRIVAAEARDHGGLTPRLLEFAFEGEEGEEGREGRAPALTLSAAGQRVRLRGRLDRVDATAARLLVIDYKRSRNDRYAEALAPERFGVDSFQIPTYLLAAARALPGRALSATYAILRDAARLEPVELAADDPRLVPAAPEDGGDSFAAAVVERVGRIRRGEFPIVSQGCEWCPLGAVCRFQGVAERGPGGAAGNGEGAA